MEVAGNTVGEISDRGGADEEIEVADGLYDSVESPKLDRMTFVILASDSVVTGV